MPAAEAVRCSGARGPKSGRRDGRMFVFETGQLTNPRFIINFPTKRHWRGKSRLEDIDAGLVGLAWEQVRPRIERALGDLPGVRVILFEPRG